MLMIDKDKTISHKIFVIFPTEVLIYATVVAIQGDKAALNLKYILVPYWRELSLLPRN